MEKNWYAVHTYSGFEKKVKDAIEERIKSLGLQDRISKILIPTEEVIEIKGGEKKVSTKKFYPGYILIEMEMDDDTWHLVKGTPKVTGFVGGGTSPVPLTTEELETIVKQIEVGATLPKVNVQFRRGENVRIIDGPFTNFTGIIDDINPDHGKLRVLVSIFGRETPVELDFLQVERVK
ncbi:MAG: transcription termination/antitermination factor NusG [Nitrospirae bacterium]|nr:transcription termination/antitermination factor NusG [Nitrospirota bacterium]